MYTGAVTKTDACVFDICVFTNKGDHDNMIKSLRLYKGKNCLTINTRDVAICS